MFGEKGEKCPDEDVLQYADSQSFIMVKHILFSTLDDAGEASPRSRRARKKPWRRKP
jgi:hypothetical protein